MTRVAAIECREFAPLVVKLVRALLQVLNSSEFMGV